MEAVGPRVTRDPRLFEGAGASEGIELMSLTFADFKAGQPAKSMFRKLRLERYLEAATSWQSLQTLIEDYNDPDKGLFVDAARRCDGVASSGERILLDAILYATDFAWLADELTERRAWARMGNVSGAWREAVAACILQRGNEHG
jgi:hypothetical protein